MLNGASAACICPVSLIDAVLHFHDIHHVSFCTVGASMLAHLVPMGLRVVRCGGAVLSCMVCMAGMCMQYLRLQGLGRNRSKTVCWHQRVCSKVGVALDNICCSVAAQHLVQIDLAAARS